MLGHYVEEILVLPNGSLNAPRVVALVSSKKRMLKPVSKGGIGYKVKEGCVPCFRFGRCASNSSIRYLWDACCQGAQQGPFKAKKG